MRILIFSIPYPVLFILVSETIACENLTCIVGSIVSFGSAIFLNLLAAQLKAHY